MPDQKVHCARLAIKTLQKAVQQYRSKETIPAGKKKEIS